jgi:hypothetical protein
MIRERVAVTSKRSVVAVKPKRRRMTMPHPGERARQHAKVLFGVSRPTVDQCLAAVDHAVYMQVAGMLPDELTAPRFVIYPDREGRRTPLGQRAPLCVCGLSRCTSKTRLRSTA